MYDINCIFAYWDSAPPVEKAELLRVSEAMAKRGPERLANYSVRKDQYRVAAKSRTALGFVPRAQ